MHPLWLKNSLIKQNKSNLFFKKLSKFAHNKFEWFWVRIYYGIFAMMEYNKGNQEFIPPICLFGQII